MLRTKMSRRAAIATFASLACLGATGASAQTPITLKFANFVGPNSFLTTQIFQPWFKQIEDESGGAVKINFLSGGSAAKPNEVIDAVRTGIVDIGWSGTSYNPGRFNAAGVTELPQIIRAPAEGSAGMATLYEKGLLDGFDGVKILGVSTTDIMRLHHAQEVKGLADFKGAKIRAAGAVLSGMVERMGATPMNVPITTLAEALAKKVVDGTAADWFSMEGFRLVEVTKTHIDLSMGATGIYLVMNQAKYNQLPLKVKAAFDKYSVRDFANFWGSRLEKESNRVRDVVAKTPGHKIIEPSAEDAAKWQEISKQVIDNWVKSTKNGAAVLEAFQGGVKAASATK
jgi:TRAP-type C4-dicarboxylate transport system substrate-binding protein